jgi:FeS assembly SUF system protein
MLDSLPAAGGRALGAGAARGYSGAMKFLSRFLRRQSADATSVSDQDVGDAASSADGDSLAGASAAVMPGQWEFGAFSVAPEPQAATELVEDPVVTAELTPRVIDALKTVFDPEIPVDIYELGLIYSIRATAERQVHVAMTLTSPACPSAQQLPSEVRFKIKALEGVTDATVDVVWEPPWDKERMSETAKLTLGLF